ncbi:MAG: hypothetical protein ACR2NR_05715 [Solirubrobacteraceae bacterium]
MTFRRIFALAGAIAALGLIASASALGAGTSVSVRIEGLKRTLLPATVTQTNAGSITKGGAPAGSCSATTAAGALDVATGHRWDGKYSSGLGIEISQIFDETHTYSPHGYYWSIFVDDHYATAGICALKLHRGEQLLFAPYPAKGTVFPIVLKAPRTATAGKPFRVKAFYYRGKGNASKPIAGVTFTGVAGATNRQGIATLTARKSGKLTLVGSDQGYVRSAVTTVKVGG